MHFVGPFGDYLVARHALTLHLDSFALTGNIRRADGGAIGHAEFPPLLNGFFDTHMATQTPVPGAAAALGRLARHADIVILTNVDDRHNGVRTAELARHGMAYPVICNSGPKGKPVAELIARYKPSATAFIDDLPPHHASVARAAPETHRLHMVAEPRLRALIPAAADAQARIDEWPAALLHLETALGIAP